MSAYYNEHDKFAAEWLRRLCDQNLITEGAVDGRSIQEVLPRDCAPTSHFFAGIGGWDYALRLAGWPEDRPVWTGSCPRQPFSNAGKRLGTADARHLWPEWFRLIKACRPVTIFGEQVESAVAHGWLDGVFADLEGEGYTCGAAVLGAHSVGAPHQRQRLYWVADSQRDPGRPRRPANEPGESLGAEKPGAPAQPGRLRDLGGIAFGASEASGGGVEHPKSLGRSICQPHDVGAADRKIDTLANSSLGRGAWDDSVWIPCRDGKARRIKSGLEPLAHGVPGRVGRLRAYGNAIVPQVAAEFVMAFMERLA